MPREPWKHNGQLQSPDKDFELVPVLSIKLWENDKNKDGQPDYSNGNMRLYNPKLKERVDLVSLSSDNTYSGSVFINDDGTCSFTVRQRVPKNYSDSITDGVKQEGLKPLAQAVENKHYPEGHQEAPQQGEEKMPWE